MSGCHAKTDIGTTASIHTQIESAFPEIEHIRAETLEAHLNTSPQTYMVFDTRPAAEYNVSHIKGALRVSPDISPKDFQSRFGALAADKSIILYCSVGWRSSKAAHKLKSAALASGAIEVKNLEGGLFDWHNSGRPLVNQTGPTQAIHPYNEKWGALIRKEADKSYRPR